MGRDLRQLLRQLRRRRAAAGRGALALPQQLRRRLAYVPVRYGNVMLDTEGMTKAGIERKATTR